MSLQLQSSGHSFCSNLDYIGQIRSQFYTCHESRGAVTTYAKEWPNLTIIIRIRSMYFFKIWTKINRLWNTSLAISSVHSRAEACDTSSKLIQSYTTQYDTTRHGPAQTVHFRNAILSQFIWVQPNSDKLWKIRIGDTIFLFYLNPIITMRNIIIHCWQIQVVFNAGSIV